MQGFTDGHGDENGINVLDGSHVEKDILQFHTVDELHGDVGLVFLLPEIIDRDDVGMLQSCRGLCLESKPLQGVGLRPEPRQIKLLQSHDTVEGLLHGLVDSGHTAPADLLLDCVVSQFLAHARSR